MTVQTTYTQARANLARLCDRATQDRETIIIKRRGAPDVAMIAADELSSIQETIHLLHSPHNAIRLLKALERAQREPGTPQTVDELRHEFGLRSER